MRTPSALLALTLASLPASALAQDTAGHAARAARVARPHHPANTSPAVQSANVTAPVALTQRGLHARIEGTLARGLEILDRQDADVDGDGDADALLLVNPAPLGEDEEPKPDLGRGVALALREAHGWRAITVGSVPLRPMEAGYNWGRVEALRAGATPLLHVLYSDMVEDVVHQRDTVLQFASGALREVFSSTVVSTPGEERDAVTRALSVQAADVDGDGTSELLERVAASTGCPASGCFGPDGMLAPSVARRVFRWDGAQGAFVAAPALSGHEREAARALEESTARWQAGDLAGRDAAVQRAWGLDPLNPRVRIAYARWLLRGHEYARGLDVLEFVWPEGFGRDALALQCEAALRANSPAAGRYLSALRDADPARARALESELRAEVARVR